MPASATSRPDPDRGGPLTRHPLVFFFIFAYAGAWVLEIPIALSETGTGILPFTLPRIALALMVVGATFLGPTLAAFVMTGVTEGRPGVRRLLRRYVLWRVSWRWYAFVLIGVPALEVIGTIAVPGALESFNGIALSLVLAYPAAFVMTFFLGGPFGEEPGWRGFALPRLQALHGPLAGGIILGVLWACWHLPLFWSGIWTPLSLANVVMFIVMITCLTVIMVWVFNNAKGSLLITMLMHASFNTFADHIVVPAFPAAILNEYPLLPELIGFGLGAVVVVALTRRRLSYGRYREYVEGTAAPAAAPAL
jgi:membrane protease YdiL (CAAX protease family)